MAPAASFFPLLSALTFAYVAYLVTGPYLQVRVANLAWSNTIFRGIRFESDLRARAFMKLQTVNVVLTLLTLGLYRPFAAGARSPDAWRKRHRIAGWHHHRHRPDAA
jgi:uncharacterized membrane protein YjgN (DUF898 family)